MSENSLEIRNKFINKINNKIKDLNENITLLSKVDNKIFKNTNSQYGGNNQFQMIKNINRQSGGRSTEELNTTILELYSKLTKQVNLSDVAEKLSKIKKDVEKLHETIGFLNASFKPEDTLEIDGIFKELAGMDTTTLLDEKDFEVIEFIKKEYKENKNYTNIYNQDHPTNIDRLVDASKIDVRANLANRFTPAHYTFILKNEDERVYKRTLRTAGSIVKSAATATATALKAPATALKAPATDLNAPATDLNAPASPTPLPPTPSAKKVST